MSSAAEQRQAVADLTTTAQRDLTLVWSSLAGLSVAEVRDVLTEVLIDLGARFGNAAVALAADWYESMRDAADVPGSFSPVVPDLPEPARWEALARWGVDPLVAAEVPDREAALARVSGGLQRSIADQHRLTIVESSIADPAAAGWRRVGVGDSCGFCRMLIDRGHVYTEASVTFRSHDHCNCAASPSFAKNVVKVTGEPFRQSRRKEGWSKERKAAENRRAYEYIAEHYGD